MILISLFQPKIQNQLTKSINGEVHVSEVIISTFLTRGDSVGTILVFMVTHQTLHIYSPFLPTILYLVAQVMQVSTMYLQVHTSTIAPTWKVDTLVPLLP